MKHTVCKTLLLAGLLTVAGFSGTDSKAANTVDTLEPKQVYEYDLDKDGTMDNLSYEMNSDHKIIITVNDKTARQITLDDTFYSPCVQVCDINTKDKTMDLWVYSYADSDDILFSALYEYKDGALTRVWKLNWKQTDNAFEEHSGKLTATNGKGSFTIAQDRAVAVDWLVGNHWDAVKYRLSNGKVTRTTNKQFAIYESYAKVSSTKVKVNGALKTAKTLRFYKNHSKSSGTITIKKGTKMYPVQSYIVSNRNVYVKFRTAGGARTGWLRVGDFSYQSKPFSNLYFAD